MAVLSPSYLDALIEGLPPAFKGTSVLHHRSVEDTQIVVESIEKLFRRLSVLLVHIDKLLPKKLNQWAMETRALKCQVSDLLKELQNRKGDSLKRKELVEVVIKMINHLRKCLSDKQVPHVIVTHKSGSDKLRRKLEQKYNSGEQLASHVEGEKVGHKQRETEQTLNPLKGHDILQEQDAGILSSAGESLPAVELQKKNDVVTLVEKLSEPMSIATLAEKLSEPMSTSKSTQGAEIHGEASSDARDVVVSSADSKSASISEGRREPRSADEVTKEDMMLEDHETKTSRNMPISVSDLGSPQAVEHASFKENVSDEQGEIESTSSDILQDQDAGILLASAGESLPAVELQKKNDVVTLVEKLSEPMSISKSTQGAEIHGEASFDTRDVVVSSADSKSAAISEGRREPQSADEVTKEDMMLEDHETKTSKNMPISVSDLGSQQAVEQASFKENVSDEQGEIESTSSRTERSKHHKEGILSPITETEHYSVFTEDNCIKLKLDDQTISIGGCPSSATTESNAVLNMVEKDLSELPEKPGYPYAMLLFLQRSKGSTFIPSSFFDGLPELRFLDLSDTRIRVLPSSLFNLLELKVLILRNCVCLEKLPSEIGKLNHMEVLDLSGTELYNLPDEIGQLTLLSHMQLSFYGPDDESEYDHLPSQLVSPTFLSKLEKIQSLSITVHPDDPRWTEIAASIVNDVGKLEMLSYLQFYFPEVEMFENFIQMSPSWATHKLRNFNFIVGHNVKRIVSRVPDEMESLFDQQYKCLRYVNGDKVSKVIKAALAQVKAFKLDHHIEIKSLSEFGISNFKALNFCVVGECPKIQVILREKTTGDAFPCLEHLGIYYLWELKHIWVPPSCWGRLMKRIWKRPSPSGNFKALKYLTINTCPKLQFIFWESMLKSLSNLEELLVEDCESLEKIVKEEDKKVYYGDVMLPKLGKLVLHFLPELVSLGNGLYLPEEKINIYGCPKLILKSQTGEVSGLKI